MEQIQLTMDGDEGTFRVSENGEQLGEMVISINDAKLTVYHTEVSDKAEGKGLAKKLFQSMVDHARQHQLKIVPLCSFVRAQLKRHAADYADVWTHP